MRTPVPLALVLLLSGLGVHTAAAHEMRPAYLELRQTTADNMEMSLVAKVATSLLVATMLGIGLTVGG
jgi:hypothetical protein